MVLLQERREKEESKNAPPCALSTTGRIVWLGLQPGRDPHRIFSHSDNTLY